jgi:hypothetical protein
MLWALPLLSLLAAAPPTPLLMCASDSTGGCDPVLAKPPWAGGPLPGTQTQPADRLELLDRRVPVPARCTGEAGADGFSRVTCGTAKVHWFLVPEGTDPDAKLKHLEDDVVAAAQGSAQLRRDAVPCRIAGIASTCRRLRATYPSGKVLLVQGWVEDEGRRLAASCVVPGETAYMLPCKLVFQLPPDPSAERAVAIAGRYAPVPARCDLDVDDRGFATDIPCEGGKFALWTIASDEVAAKATAERGLKGIREAIQGHARDVRVDEAPCRMSGGVSASCRRVRFVDDGTATTFLTAVAQIQREWVVAACMEGEAADPRPCSLVFEAH